MIARHSNVVKFIAFGIRWIVIGSAQVVFFSCYVAWACLHIVVWWGPIILIGCFLFQLKSMCVKRVWNMWVLLYTLTPTKLMRHCGNVYRWCTGEKLLDPDGDLYTHWKSCDVTDTDAGMFSESLLAEFVFEAMPQLLLQGLNNTYTYQWGNPITRFSFAFSFAMIVNGIWTLVYPIVMEGMTINDVPLRVKILGYVIEITTETAANMPEAVRRHKLSVLAWKQLSYEFNRLTVMDRNLPHIAATADSLAKTFQATSIFNATDLTPHNVALVMVNLNDKPAVNLFRMRKLYEFDEKCARAREAELERADFVENPMSNPAVELTGVTSSTMSRVKRAEPVQNASSAATRNDDSDDEGPDGEGAQAQDVNVPGRPHVRGVRRSAPSSTSVHNPIVASPATGSASGTRSSATEIALDSRFFPSPIKPSARHRMT
jgi:hypothetical protein